MSEIISSEQHPTGVSPTTSVSLSASSSSSSSSSSSNPSSGSSAASGAGSATLEVQFEGFKELGFQLSTTFAAHPAFVPDGAEQQGFPDTVPTSPAHSFPGPSASLSRSVSPFFPEGASPTSGRRRAALRVIGDPELVHGLADEASSVRGFKDQETRDKYLRRRAKNNEAASKSRKKKRELEEANSLKAKELADENARLKEELQDLRAETRTLKDMLSMLWQSKK